MKNKEGRSLTSRKIRRRFLGLPTPKRSIPKTKEAWERPGNSLEMEKKVGEERRSERGEKKGDSLGGGKGLL